jgi:hypothetical protein
MEFFNNKENENLKFKINSEGIDINKIEPRLILTTKENKNYLFLGEVENGVCKFNIPQLGIYEKGDHGKVKFEIISEDLYFPVWQDNFEIKSKASIKIEEMFSEIQENTIKMKPKISSEIITEILSKEKKEPEKPILEKKDKTEQTDKIKRFEE